MKRKIYAALLTILLLLTSAGCNIPGEEAFKNASSNHDIHGTQSITTTSIRAHILDVGQGLAVFLKAGDSTLLYDGGNTDTTGLVVDYLLNQGVETLDYVIASHYDADHLAGIIAALHAFDTQLILAPDYEADTYTYQMFQKALAQWKLTPISPQPGDTYPLGDGNFEILAPLNTDYEDENDHSIVIRVSIGDSTLLITGDASAVSEQEMLSNASVLASDVLVIGHHGSYNSTSDRFLETVSPQYAIISCGLHNDYEHPAKRVVTLLAQTESKLYRTDLQDTICFTMTANDILFDFSPCDDYSSGEELNSNPDYPVSDNPLSADNETIDYSRYSYILNTNRNRFHLTDCESVQEMSPYNRQGTTKSRDELIAGGFSPCGTCKP